MSNRQYTTPLVIQRRGAKEDVIKLDRIFSDDQTFDEKWFQQKLFQHPDLVPAAVIEPAFEGLKAVAKELKVGNNFADLLFVNPDGCIAIIETKLFRNQEARREVIAQVIDYASELSGWSYDQLVQAIKRANKSTEEDPLLRIMRGSVQDRVFDESRFRERITRNLQLGRILLLIVGDDITDEAQRMAEFINRTPHLHFTFGLIEIALFTENENSKDQIFVQPRVVAQTRLDVRAVVEIKLPDGAEMRTEVTPVKPTKVERTSISEEQFYEELGRVSPVAVELAKWALGEAPKHQLAVDWGAGGPMLKYLDARGEEFSFGQLWKSGEFDPRSLLPKFMKLRRPEDIASDYLDDITHLVPGAHRKEWPWDKELKTEVILYPEGSDEWLPFAELAPHKEKWFEAIDKAIARIQRLSSKS